MLVGFARYNRDRSFVVLGANGAFVFGDGGRVDRRCFIGGALLGLVPSPVPAAPLAVILVPSAVKVCKHK